MKAIMIVIIVALYTTSTLAGEIKMDPVNNIEVPISANSLTRISIKDNDKITTYFRNKTELDVQADLVNGYLIIQPISPELDRVRLTIATRAGRVQDLLLKLENNKHLGPIVLVPSDSTQPELNKGSNEEVVINLIKKIDRYGSVANEKLPELTVNGNKLLVKQVAFLKESNLEAVKLVVQNPNSREIVLEEPLFLNEGTVAVLIKAKTLKFNEETEVIVVRKGA